MGVLCPTSWCVSEVDAVVVQIRNATATDPSLASPQLHKGMSDLILKVHGEP